tara:strand:- start:16385 stop:18058 length:1674 start_codon:yes stop_codon:yes gene_type:complete
MTTVFSPWGPEARTREIADRLTRWPSVTGSKDEADFADKLVGLLREIPYFQENPDDIAVIDSHLVANGTAMAKNVVALVRGQGRKTLALAGHFDVVSIENYHDLQHLAFAPDVLCTALIKDLSERSNLTAKEKLALKDLQSGDFIPGRGLLDMKSGDAAGISFLEHFSQLADRTGNVVLFLTPDEERNSCGMRSLRNALPDLVRRWDIDIVGGINLDASSDYENGDMGRAIFHGSIGKMMPFAMIVGQPTHVGYPFDGISAHVISAEIMQMIEGNTDLSDTARNVMAPPPVCLECRDLRENYEVTTPEHVWMAFNWLIQGKTSTDVLAEFAAIVEVAANRALTRLFERAKIHAQANGEPAPMEYRPLAVVSYARLLDMARDMGGEAALARIAAVEEEYRYSNNPLLRSRVLVQATLAEARLSAPAIITGNASLHYPAVHLDTTRPLDRAFIDAIHAARQVIEARHDTKIIDRGYFGGISDMSFFGKCPESDESKVIAENTPVGELVDHPVVDALEYPVVNIGPWGREYHQRLERLYAPYCYKVLPDFLAEIARKLLG